MLPQRQTTSSWPARRTWPMSPAAPCAPRWMRRPDDDPAADAGADLHVEQVLDVAPVRPVLAQRHDVDVVVDEHRRVVVAREPVGDREAVPAGHHRRRDRLAAPERDRRGHADADPADVAPARSGGSEQLLEALVDPREHDVRASRATSVSYARSASGVPPRSQTASRECVAPRSATSTTPALRLKASTVGGRPPVEALPPAS